jgi:hypothetical protein
LSTVSFVGLSFTVSLIDSSDDVHVLTAEQAELAHCSVADESLPPPQPAASTRATKTVAGVNAPRVGIAEKVRNPADSSHHPDRMTRGRSGACRRTDGPG